MTPYEAGQEIVRGLAARATVAGASSSTSVHVNVPVTASTSATDVFSSPRYQQALQEAVRKAVLRYDQIEPVWRPRGDDDDDGLSGALVPA